MCFTCVMLDKPMMNDIMQTKRMNTFFLFLKMMGYSSTKAVMKPSTVQNYGEIIDHYFTTLSVSWLHMSWFTKIQMSIGCVKQDFLC